MFRFFVIVTVSPLYPSHVFVRKDGAYRTLESLGLLHSRVAVNKEEFRQTNYNIEYLITSVKRFVVLVPLKLSPHVIVTLNIRTFSHYTF
jgi:hypothetical protein